MSIIRTWTDDDLQELLDKEAINDLLIRWCRGVDRLDEELILSCYHPDAYDDHGMVRGSPAELVTWLKTTADRVAFMEHKLSNVYLEIDGDVAFGECYSALHLQQGDIFGEAYSRFIDRFERRDGEWRIARRRVTLEWASPELGFDRSHFVAGRRDRGDPSYER
jgi:hypothetical protein